jgi:hypothetical protein
MWVYQQQTGDLTSQSGNKVASGYSGIGSGLNNPVYESVPDVGPIPCGFYNILEPIDDPLRGPYAMHLNPFAENQMFGRSAFMVHGDEVAHAGEHLASHGCLIFPRVIREMIWNSDDHQLQVTKVGVVT